MKRISLTQGQFALVDDEDFERVNQFKWHAFWTPHTRSFCAKRMVARKNVYMARVIMNAEPEQKVDHCNHNTLDNRRENLRVCTNGQNTMNGRKRSTNTSGFVGVHWNKRRQKWRAEICCDRVSIILGYYTDKLVAAHVRKMEAAILHRDFAYAHESAIEANPQGIT
jgi:hypothetical protein